MFRRSAAFCAAAPLSEVAKSQRDLISKMSFHAEYMKLRTDDSDSNQSHLGSKEYNFLQAKMEEYADFQSKYAVKQSEMERTRNVANYCGLETNKIHRRDGADRQVGQQDE